MGKNKVPPSEQVAKNIVDLNKMVFGFFDERGIDYEGGLALLGTTMTAAFLKVCSSLSVPQERAKRIFKDLLDAMKERMEKWPANEWPMEEGDNETTDAN